jgi:hypothetical protein
VAIPRVKMVKLLVKEMLLQGTLMVSQLKNQNFLGSPCSRILHLKCLWMSWRNSSQKYRFKGHQHLKFQAQRGPRLKSRDPRLKHLAFILMFPKGGGDPMPCRIRSPYCPGHSHDKRFKLTGVKQGWILFLFTYCMFNPFHFDDIIYTYT